MVGWMDGGWGTGAWVLMSLSMLVFWGGLIAVAVWVVHSLRADRTPPPPPRPASTTTHADDVLAERFARGEIDEEEFTRRRRVLHSST